MSALTAAVLLLAGYAAASTPATPTRIRCVRPALNAFHQTPSVLPGQIERMPMLALRAKELDAALAPLPAGLTAREGMDYEARRVLLALVADRRLLAESRGELSAPLGGNFSVEVLENAARFAADRPELAERFARIRAEIEVFDDEKIAALEERMEELRARSLDEVQELQKGQVIDARERFLPRAARRGSAEAAPAFPASVVRLSKPAPR